MKVLVINWRDIKNPEAGGAEIHIDEILKRRPKDWKVDFVSAGFKGAPKNEKINGYNVIRIPDNFLFNYTFRNYWKKTLSKNNYDLVIDDISKIPLATPLYIKNTPVFAIHHHIHGKSLFKELFYPMAMYVYLMEKHYLRCYRETPTIVMADSDKIELEKHYAYRKAIISPTGMEYEWIRKNARYPRNKKPTLIYFGRLKKYKRVDHILKAFQLVKKQVPDCLLWIGGKGDQEDNLKALAMDLGLEKDVVFYGFVSDRKKVELMARSWVYAIASEKEGWGLTVVEANAAGLPVVGYQVEGLKDSIRNGQTGYLVPNGDVEKLAGKITLLLKNKKINRSLTAKSVKWASKFSWENTARDFYQHVKAFLAGCHKRADK